MGVYQSKPHDIYDIILRIDSIDTAFGGGWAIESASEIKSKQYNGCVIGVMGLFNRGKSFVLGQLAEVPFKDGDTVNTVGLSIKFLEIENAKKTAKRRHVILDSAGSNRPLSLRTIPQNNNNNKDSNTEETDQNMVVFEQQEMTEDFLNSAIVNLADYVIIVVNQLTAPDQKFIYQVTKERSMSEKSYKEVWVVHNLRTTKTEEEMKFFWKVVCDSYNGSKVLDKDKDIDFFISPEHCARHVCIVDQNSDWGKLYNKKVFTMMRNWIDSIVAVPIIDSAEHPIKPIEKVCSKLIPKYTEGVVGVTFDEKTMSLKAVPKGSEIPKLKTDQSTKQMEVLSSFSPRYAIVEDSGTYVVILEAPGTSHEEIKVQKRQTDRPNCWKISISGHKHKTIPTGSSIVTDRLQEGAFVVYIDVPVDYFPRPKKASKDGIITITFDKMDLPEV